MGRILICGTGDHISDLVQGTRVVDKEEKISFQPMYCGRNYHSGGIRMVLIRHAQQQLPDPNDGSTGMRTHLRYMVDTLEELEQGTAHQRGSLGVR